MPPFASRRTLLEAATRVQVARSAQMPCSALFAGITYECEGSIGEATPEVEASSGNVHIVQRGYIKVLKTDMPVPPKRDAVIKIDGVDYKVESVGSGALSPAWNIKFYRLPPV